MSGIITRERRRHPFDNTKTGNTGAGSDISAQGPGPITNSTGNEYFASAQMENRLADIARVRRSRGMDDIELGKDKSIILAMIYRFASISGYVILASSVVMLGWVVGQVAMGVLSKDTPPIEVHNVEVLESVARAGDVVHIKITRTRDRYCPGVVNEFWVQNDTSVHQGRVVPSSPTSELGLVTTTFIKTLPTTLEIGRACYVPILTFSCNGKSITYAQPPACLRVIR